MLKRLIYRVVGPPPDSGATREVQLRWIRQFYRLSLAALVVVVIVSVVTGGEFWWILTAVLAVLWVAGFASISITIRREGSPEN